MRKNFYFWVAARLITLEWVAKKAAIYFDYWHKLLVRRAVMLSKMTPADKINLMQTYGKK